MHRTFLTVVTTVLLAQAASGQVVLNRDDALDMPSRHAWNLFLLVNHPAADPKSGRGVPDLSKRIGAPGTTVLWETWRLSETEVFLPKGIQPPDWNDLTLPGGPVTGKVPELPKHLLLAKLAIRPQGFNNDRSRVGPLFDPNEGVFKGQGGFGESRMNRATYEFVKLNKLYSVEGQRKYAQDVVVGNKSALSFPVDSMEVKAAWIEFNQQDLAAGKASRYYLAEYDGKKYGLTSLHIITKDIPNWFWCTFHHVDSPNTGIETPDTYGRPKALTGTVWENYKLGGTQTDFVTSVGQPTLLSDPYIEAGFERSSCISCHARATVSADSNPPLGSRAVVGVPDPGDYVKNGKTVLMQTDFLFSLPFRAKSEK